MERSHLQVTALKRHMDNQLLEIRNVLSDNSAITGPPLRLHSDQSSTRIQLSLDVPRSGVNFATFVQSVQSPTGYECYNYSQLMQNVIVSTLEPFVGQLSVSKWLLDTLHLLPWESKCTHTCWQNKTVPLVVNWTLPPIFYNSGWSVQINTPSLLVSVHAPRVVSIRAEVWEVIRNGDLAKLRMLFATRQASIYDVREDGFTLLYVSGLMTHIGFCCVADRWVRMHAGGGADRALTAP